MTWQVRKSKSFGGLRFTAGKRGVSTSIGWGPFRISLGNDGKVRRTVRPLPGVYSTEVINDDGDASPRIGRDVDTSSG